MPLNSQGAKIVLAFSFPWVAYGSATTLPSLFVFNSPSPAPWLMPAHLAADVRATPRWRDPQRRLPGAGVVREFSCSATINSRCSRLTSAVSAAFACYRAL